ncbi:MAG: hypothetical protein J6Y62_03865 [Clostridia bacterium]|nr:hypothetical protein [Clostridia bacterium]
MKNLLHETLAELRREGYGEKDVALILFKGRSMPMALFRELADRRYEPVAVLKRFWRPAVDQSLFLILKDGRRLERRCGVSGEEVFEDWILTEGPVRGRIAAFCRCKRGIRAVWRDRWRMRRLVSSGVSSAGTLFTGAT